jgi:hypothetical protein
MARFSLTSTSTTTASVADATNFVDQTYPFLLQGGSSTMRLNINEIYMGGESGSSAPQVMVLARDSTVGASVTAGQTRNAAGDGSSTAPGTLPVVGNAATTKPQRSATLHLLHPSFNAFGGISRWQARPGEEISVVGNTASLGEMSLSAYTGTTAGQMSCHCIYEEA